MEILPNEILLEPLGRNTCPAIAISALVALEKEKDPILLVLSSDHEIKQLDKFIKNLNTGFHYAKDNKLVTFGVLPTSPETGYGYIKAEKPFNESERDGQKISKFTEKPDQETAKNFLKDKRYTWNSGIFTFKAKTIIAEIEKFNPSLMKNCRESLRGSRKDLDFLRIDCESFKKCQDISIDIAVMEKTSKGIVVPLEALWSDVGSWDAVWENAQKDSEGNVVHGKILSRQSKNCYLRSENRLVVGIGLKELIVVETGDAVLVASKEKSQCIKDIVKELKNNNIPEGLSHKKIYRPWGFFTSLAEDNRWQVKLIEVKPGEKLSLQMHHHRSEHWVVVSGTAKVEVDNQMKILSENESIYIPLGSKHRLSNPGKINLTLIEVQSGSYVGEDDIVRFEDKYGRKN
jgi:mannose-1-phosphate guanylyltransferase